MVPCQKIVVFLFLLSATAREKNVVQALLQSPLLQNLPRQDFSVGKSPRRYFPACSHSSSSSACYLNPRRLLRVGSFTEEPSTTATRGRLRPFSPRFLERLWWSSRRVGGKHKSLIGRLVTSFLLSMVILSSGQATAWASTTTTAAAPSSAVAAAAPCLIASPISAVSQLHLSLQLLCAALTGAAIGKERSSSRYHPAGVRTMSLVAMGAALFTICSRYGFVGTHYDTSRMASNVASGVGFIGAGVIYHEQSSRVVHGLTTAAAIWMSAAVGVACGTGMYMVAPMATGMTLCILRMGGGGKKRRGSLYQNNGEQDDEELDEELDEEQCHVHYHHHHYAEVDLQGRYRSRVEPRSDRNTRDYEIRSSQARQDQPPTTLANSPTDWTDFEDVDDDTVRDTKLRNNLSITRSVNIRSFEDVDDDDTVRDTKLQNNLSTTRSVNVRP